jgi:hypothetical protein
VDRHAKIGVFLEMSHRFVLDLGLCRLISTESSRWDERSAWDEQASHFIC